MKKALFVLALSLLAAGCAGSPETSTAASGQRAERGEVPTGSNIPRRNRDGNREGVQTMSREELERAQQSGGHVGRTAN